MAAPSGWPLDRVGSIYFTPVFEQKHTHWLSLFRLIVGQHMLHGRRGHNSHSTAVAKPNCGIGKTSVQKSTITCQFQVDDFI